MYSVYFAYFYLMFFCIMYILHYCKGTETFWSALRNKLLLLLLLLLTMNKLLNRRTSC